MEASCLFQIGCALFLAVGCCCCQGSVAGRAPDSSELEASDARIDELLNPDEIECGAGEVSSLQHDGMVVVAGKSFMMGCERTLNLNCGEGSEPYHEVDVPSFWMDTLEVTVRQYRSCVEAGACDLAEAALDPEYCNYGREGRDDHPMNCVEWRRAGKYCFWAGKRLCTEAEWEKAAKGTDARDFPWGDEPPTCSQGIFAVGGPDTVFGCGAGTTWPVGSAPAGASPYGILDLAGNVAEWVEDRAHFGYVGAPSDGRAWLAPAEPYGETRVLRGCSFMDPSDACLTWMRVFGSAADSRFGIRCCASD